VSIVSILSIGGSGGMGRAARGRLADFSAHFSLNRA